MPTVLIFEVSYHENILPTRRELSVIEEVSIRRGWTVFLRLETFLGKKSEKNTFTKLYNPFKEHCHVNSLINPVVAKISS